LKLNNLKWTIAIMNHNINMTISYDVSKFKYKRIYNQVIILRITTNNWIWIYYTS